MTRSGLRSGLGALLILAGVLLPPSTLIHALRVPPAALLEPLLRGATLFKIGLAVLGVALVAWGRIFHWPPEPPRATPGARPSAPPARALLAAVLVAAAALRLYGLDAGLWHDEIVTYVKYAKLSFGEIVSTYDSENQHFLYSLLAHASVSLWGDSAWALRLPAVLFGVASVWALFLFGREVAGTREALWAAALLTVSYHHVWYSQNARGYTGLLFWTLLASWLLVRALADARPRPWILYALAVAPGVYTHITMLFVVAGHVLIALLAAVIRPRGTPPPRWAGPCLGFGLAGLLTLQLHALVLPQIVTAIGATESVVGAWKRPAWTLLELLQGVQVGFAGIALAALVIFGIGVLSFLGTRPVVIQLLVLPAAIVTAVILARGHHLWPRFFFFAFGFGALVLVRGAVRLGEAAAHLLRPTPTRRRALGAAVAAALIAAAAISLPLVYGPKQDYQGALAFVEASREPADAVVTVGLATFAYRHFYRAGWDAADSVAALDAVRARAGRTWVLYTLRPVLASVAPDLVASLERDFRLVRAFSGTLAGGTIFVRRSDTPPPAATAGFRSLDR